MKKKKINNNTSLVFTVEDEFPCCMECDHCCECNGENCGAEHSWKQYQRTEILFDINNDEEN